ncbi:purine/pyrimidine permease [Paenibacillus sp. FJAT-26967]|uniref:purine/pyrimidine permease n=1 Tax=Paenibacillus sp. FJAT-26967 TaxID=1729690 RepID=UPI00083933DB|nr:purine/pyrimidine permease [Paenibacillus sp. FJAT-26967]
MKLFLSTIQWLVFILAGSLVAPLAVGNVLGLPPEEIASFMQRTFLLIGVSALLQTLFGHKLPMMEGPAGLWWGVFVVYAGLIASGSLALTDGLRQLEMGMLITGGLFLLLGAMGWIGKIRKLFTPLVTGTYLIILVAQLSGSFMKGLFGIGYLTDEVDVRVALPAFGVLLIAMLLPRSRFGFLRNYSVLISLLAGWLLFIALGIAPEVLPAASAFDIPGIFEWGLPQWDAGVLPTSILIGLLLLANLIASIAVVEKVVAKSQPDMPPVDYNRTSLIMGVSTALGGVFSAMGCVPISGTAGFMLTTGLVKRLPFILAAAGIALVSFFPPVTAVLTSLPMPVGYAVIFIPFASMIGLALREYQSLQGGDRDFFIIGVSLMIGIGSLFVPAQAIAHLPGLIRTIANNGLVLGMLVCILLEQLFIYREKAALRGKDGTNASS